MAKFEAALTREQVQTVAKDVLASRFAPFGFQALDVKEEEDLDGGAILRMIAEVTSRVPASELIGTLVALRRVLESKGDDRVVLLNTHVPGVEGPQEDQDEDE